MIYSVNGVDVSEYQGQMTWSKALDQGIQFAYIRASKGYREDLQYDRNVAELTRLNIPFGVYGVLFAQYDPAPQIASFLPLIAGQLPPVCDLERPGTGEVYPVATVRAHVSEYVQAVKAKTNGKCLIYSSKGWWDHWLYMIQPVCPFWVANYTSALKPAMPVAVTSWEFWQWSADGNGKGAQYGAQSAAIDLDRYNGTPEQFRAEYLDGAPPPPPPPQPTTLVVAVTPANFRRTPDALPASRLGQLFKGAELEVIKREGDYWKVKITGYLHHTVVKDV